MPAETSVAEKTAPAAVNPFTLLRLMLAVEYTDHQNVVRPAVVTKIFMNGIINLVSYGVHAGDPPTDMVCDVLYNASGGAPHRWRFYAS